MTSALLFIGLSKPSILSFLSENEQQRIRRNAEAARERLKNARIAADESQLAAAEPV